MLLIKCYFYYIKNNFCFGILRNFLLKVLYRYLVEMEEVIVKRFFVVKRFIKCLKLRNFI